MTVLIWGAGAVGGTIGAYLARSGHPVLLVDREGEHVATMRQSGLRISGPVDEFSVTAPACLPEELDGTFQTVLLCVKALDTEHAAHQLKPHLAPDGCVVSVQNGLNELILANIVGRERTIGAFVNFGADYLEPGHIHRGNRAAVVLGELGGQITPRLQALHRLFLDFDDRTVMTTNIWGYLWGKLAYGALLFATALTNESIADALALPQFQETHIAIMQEVLQVAQAHGIEPEAFDGFDPQAFMPGTDPRLAAQSLAALVTFNRGSAKTHSGIWRDLAVRKRRTEVDQQLGPILTHAQIKGLKTPLIARIIHPIHEIEEGLRPQSIETLEQLKHIIE